jgi:cytochrome bd-type quinol oxidase subunit 2
MKQIRLLLATFAIFLGLSGMVPAVALADTAKTTVCQTLGSGSNCTHSRGTSLNHIVKAIVNILSIVVGVVAVIMVILGGFKYITSGGDSNKVASARNTIVYALVGLVVVALAQAIVQFVLHSV